MALLEVRDLARSFGPIKAVDGADLSVEPGEIFGLVGPDGAGKSTTLRMICGLLDPDRGALSVDGIDVAAQPEQVRDRLGYMPQQYSLYADLTVRENLEFFADMYFVPRDVRRKRLARLYEFSRLEPYADRPAGKLSGGMYKKLALSCNMIHTPKLLLLDEPTNGVDPLSRRELWEILYSFAAQGVAIVVSTPYMDEAERCHRVALMHQGRMLAVDAPQAILERFGDELYELERTSEVRALLASLPEVLRVYPAGDALKVVLAAGTGEGPIRKALESAGIEARALRLTLPNFEDVFLARVESGQ
ncbi:MAG: ABC transporter ATP-binding protein [Candidatus Alcyoniella australis]|nr:ABC transporter ATP-binding protein [Candidatus Alcyoniella australis]